MTAPCDGTLEGIMKMSRKQLGTLIRRARVLVGWSATELALKLEVSGQSVSLAERGGTPFPRGSDARAVEMLLDELAAKFGTERTRPRLGPDRAARLLAVATAQAGLERDAALASWS